MFFGVAVCARDGHGRWLSALWGAVDRFSSRRSLREGAHGLDVGGGERLVETTSSENNDAPRSHFLHLVIIIIISKYPLVT